MPAGAVSQSSPRPLRACVPLPSDRCRDEHSSRGSRDSLGRRITRLATAVRIAHPHDIVLAQIAAALNLDQLQRHLARVLQAMRVAERNLGGLVFRAVEVFVVDRKSTRLKSTI